MALNQQDISPEIRGFLEDLMEEAEVIIPDSDIKEEMIQKMDERLNKLLFLRLAKAMSHEQVQIFIKMNEEDKPKKEIDKFLLKAVPDISTVLKDAMAEFRMLYLGGGKKHV